MRNGNIVGQDAAYMKKAVSTDLSRKNTIALTHCSRIVCWKKAVWSFLRLINGILQSFTVPHIVGRNGRKPADSFAIIHHREWNITLWKYTTIRYLSLPWAGFESLFILAADEYVRLEETASRLIATIDAT